jgi:uncharacterized protein (UPF0261 family)
MPVLLIGTLDTKGVEFQFVCDLLHQAGVATSMLGPATLIALPRLPLTVLNPAG